MKKLSKSYLILAGAVFLAGSTPMTHGGQLTILFYDGVGFSGIEGLSVSDLTSDSTFPDGSTASDIVPRFETEFLEFVDEDDGIDNYGSWTRGYIQAPQSGAFQFFISSDDASEFWLSKDPNPVNRNSGSPTAFESVCCTGSKTNAEGLFTGARLNERQSAAIDLVAGDFYYFEVLHKEAGGGSWWRLGWQRPDGIQEQIPASVAQPYVANPSLALLGHPFDQSVSEPSPATFSVDFTAAQPATLQWFHNNSPIDGATLTHYRVEETTLSMSGDQFRVEVTDANGNATTSFSATLFVTADTTSPMADFAVTGGNLDEITVGFSERVSAASAENIENYSVDKGVTVESAALSTEGDSVLLKVSKLTQLTGYTLTVKDVQDNANNPNTLSPNPTTLTVILFDIFDFDQTAEGPWSDPDHTSAIAPKVANRSVKQDAEISSAEYGGFEGVAVIGGIHGHINAFPNDRSWDNPADSSFTFYLSHDDEWVYVGVDVKDDVINTDDTARSYWKDDSIEIVVDVQNDDFDINTDTSEDAYGGHLYFNYEGKTSDTEHPSGAKDGGALRWAAAVDWTYGEEGDMFGFGKEVEGGWRTEMRFKKILFEDPEIGNKLDDGFTMGFNIGIDDDDKRGPGPNGDGSRSQDLEIQYFWANRARYDGLDAAYIESGAPIADLPLIIDSAGRIRHGGAGDIIFAPAQTDPPVLEKPVLVQGDISIIWAGGGVLQEAPAVTGPWTKVSNQNNPYTGSATSPALFFRVIRE